MEYTLYRSQRKTIAICITKDAKVEVRAPLKMPQDDIDRFIGSKMNWIKSNLEIMRVRYLGKGAFCLDFGDKILFRGREYPIIAKSDSNHAGFDGESFYPPPHMSRYEIKYEIVQVYKVLAKNVITSQIVHYSEIMNLFPKTVKINSASTRWGSCSNKDNINFTWRLVLASDDVIEYVVVHEMAHISEHNHSDKFWKVVESIIPDYKIRQQKLKALEERLSKEDWIV